MASYIPYHFISGFWLEGLNPALLTLLICLLWDTAHLALPLQGSLSHPHLCMGLAHSQVSPQDPAFPLHSTLRVIIVVCLLQALSTFENHSTEHSDQQTLELGRKRQHPQPLQNAEEVAEALKSPGAGLFAVVWIKSKAHFLLSDEIQLTAYSLRAFFKEHGYHLLRALTPELKGLAKVVALSE